jgi:hypothetical protein
MAESVLKSNLLLTPELIRCGRYPKRKISRDNAGEQLELFLDEKSERVKTRVS